MSTEDCAGIRTANLQDATRVQGDQSMTKTVSCNLNLKELCYYQFHKWTAMKTLDNQLIPELLCSKPHLIVNGLYSA